ncbi:hypothetical protein D3C73_1127680 [compost metagenome]
MIQGAMLAFTQQCCARQDDGQDRDVVDDLDDRQEPATLQVGIEQRSCRQQHGGLARRIALATVVQQFALENPPDIASTHERLAHGGGINVDLQCRLVTAQQIGLKIGWNIDHEGVPPTVQHLVHLVIRQRYRRLKFRRPQDLGQLA